jgi:hypothetical protein
MGKRRGAGARQNRSGRSTGSRREVKTLGDRSSRGCVRQVLRRTWNERWRSVMVWKLRQTGIIGDVRYQVPSVGGASRY